MTEQKKHGRSSFRGRQHQKEKRVRAVGRGGSGKTSLNALVSTGLLTMQLGGKGGGD